MTGIQALTICVLALSCALAVTSKEASTTDNNEEPVKDFDSTTIDSKYITNLYMDLYIFMFW